MVGGVGQPLGGRLQKGGGQGRGREGLQADELVRANSLGHDFLCGKGAVAHPVDEVPRDTC